MKEIKIVNNEKISRNSYLNEHRQVVNDLFDYLRVKNKNEDLRRIYAHCLLVDFNIVALFASNEQIENIENDLNKYLIQYSTTEDVIQLNNDLYAVNLQVKDRNFKLPKLNANTTKEVK